MKRDTLSLIVLCAILAGVFALQTGKITLPNWVPVVTPAVKVTAATYIYEKDEGGVPSAVTAALSKINEQGIVATAIDDDVVNPSGQVPKQYEVSIPAARAAGLPALVVMAGDKVAKVVKAPTTQEQVLESVK